MTDIFVSEPAPIRPGKGALMNKLFGAAAALSFGVAVGFAASVEAADEPPAWAYGFEALSDNTTLYTLPDSKFSFTQPQVINR
jgi:hypothetical protein